MPGQAAHETDLGLIHPINHPPKLGVFERVRRALDGMRVVPQAEVERRIEEAIDVFDLNQVDPNGSQISDYIDKMYPIKNWRDYVRVTRIHAGLDFLERSGVVRHELIPGEDALLGPVYMRTEKATPSTVPDGLDFLPTYRRDAVLEAAERPYRRPRIDPYPPSDQ